MPILLAISMLCLFALMLATVVIVRHIHAGGVPANPQLDFAQHLFAAAAADQDSPPTPQQNAKDVVATPSCDRAFESILSNFRNP